MATHSPPKPWERAGGAQMASATHAMPSSNPTMTTTLPTAAAAPSSSEPPALPAKPSSLSSIVNRNATNYSPYTSGAAYGASPYGGMGGYNSYASPYNRFGGMGGSMYGGGYNSMLGGGMGGMYGGYPGRPGMMGGGEDPNSLTNSFNQSTQATFQIIESIVGAFGGFAQMLESTYYATHSSFFAMISVAEQFSNLRDTLGSILGIYWLLRWFRTAVARLTGRPPPADATALTPSAFARFQGQPAALPDGTHLPPRPSKKPFLVFLLAAFGLPYIMGKLIRALARSQDERQQQQGLLMDVHGHPLPPDQQNAGLDPSQLDYCRARYDYTPAAGASTPGLDLAVKKGDPVAVLARTDPMGQPSDWWRCRARDGRVGYLPGPYLEVIRRAGETLTGPRQLTAGSSASAPGSRAQTMSTEGSSGRAATMDGRVPVPVPRVGNGTAKPGPLAVEDFQKSHFYS